MNRLKQSFTLRRRTVICSAFFVLLTGSVLGLLALSHREKPGDLLQFGLSLIQKRQLDDASDIAVQLEMSGSRGEAAILRGQLALEKRDYTTALEQAYFARKYLPKAFELAWSVEVEALYNMGRLAEAESVAASWSARVSQSSVPVRWLGAIYYDLGAMEQARLNLIRLIQLKPEDPMARYLLGVIYHDYERYAEAIEAFEGLLNLAQIPEGTRFDATLRLGHSLLRQHQYQKAHNVLIPLKNSAKAMARCADAQLNLGDEKLAQTYLDTAHCLDPEEPEALMVQAMLAMSNQNYEEATTSLETLLSRETANAEAHHRLSRCYRLMGRTEDADRQQATTERIQSQMVQLADLHRKAIGDPWNAELREQMAKLSEQLGKHDQASMWLRAAAACRQSGSLSVGRGEHADLSGLRRSSGRSSDF